MRSVNENKLLALKGNSIFEVACQNVPPPWGSSKEGSKGIPVTKRQASKWLMKKGIAYKVNKGII